MRIDIVTLFPAMFGAPLEESIIKRAREKGLVSIAVHNLRDFADPPHRQVDDTLYGGGAGMILKIEPLDRLLGQLTERAGPGHILIFLTPQGKPYTQPEAAELAAGRHLILLCGHYKGIDERVRIKYRPREISIGDYVLSGGEIPALVVIDSVVRLLPGAVGDEDSVRTDSFQQGLLDCPHYTRPPEYQGMAVPEVLVSGHHGRIAAWRRQQSQERTARVRPDLAGGGGEKPPGTGSDPKGT